MRVRASRSCGKGGAGRLLVACVLACGLAVADHPPRGATRPDDEAVELAYKVDRHSRYLKEDSLSWSSGERTCRTALGERVANPGGVRRPFLRSGMRAQRANCRRQELGSLRRAPNRNRTSLIPARDPRVPPPRWLWDAGTPDLELTGRGLWRGVRGRRGRADWFGGAVAGAGA